MKFSGSALANEKQVGARLQRKSRRRSFQLLLGFLLSSAFLYLALRGINPARTWQQLESVNPALLSMAILIGSSGNLIRAVRWKVLLGYSTPIRFRHLFSSMMIGYMANNVLPARMGELARIYLLERSAGISKSRSAATIVLERIIDALVLLTIVGVISVFLPLDDLLRRSGLIAAVTFATFGIVLLFLAFKGETAAKQTARIVGAISENLGHRAQQIVGRFAEGLGVLRSIRQALLVLLLTLTIWSVEAIAVTLVMRSLNLNLPWLAALFLLVVLSLSFILPAAPGGVGTYEFFVVAAMVPFALDNSRAVGLALVLHANMYVTSGILGLVCLWSENLSLRELKNRA
jgi:glycosyltransferase 2 family protein